MIVKTRELSRDEVKTRCWSAEHGKLMNPVDLGARVYKISGPWWTLFVEPRKSWHSAAKKGDK